MALPAFRMTLTIRDSEKRDSDVTFYLGGAVDMDAAVAAATAIEAKVALLIDGIVVKNEVTQVLSRSAAFPSGNIDAEIKGVWAFYTTDTLVSQISLPTFKRSLLIPNKKEIDGANAAVSDFEGYVIAGAVTDNRGASWASVKSRLEDYKPRYD